MRRLLGSLLVLATLLVQLGCAVPYTRTRYLAAVPYTSVPLSPRAKIFLVAGGVDVANFAAEVVAQRRLWLDRGYAPDEIACYWARPSAAAFRRDRAQYRELAHELRACHPASTALLREHLRATSRRAPPFVYLYVSSHGNADILPEDVRQDSLLPNERALFDQTVIQLGSGPGRGISPLFLMMLMRRGADPDDLVFSPRILRDLLLAFPTATRKFVVLQACHSGGFLADARSERQADTLAGVPGLTAIASARFDRTSFGCDSGARMTYFGAAYQRLLTAHGAGPRVLDRHGIDWLALFEQLRTEIAALEREVDVQASLPQLLRTP
jgi:hypothetical protein